MNEKRLNEELSAYLDGEAPSPEAIARLLQRDEEAARRYMELSKLSAHLKSLPEPEVHPAFATRVLAEARETEPAPHLAVWWKLAPLGVATAVLAVVIIVVADRNTSTPSYEPDVAVVLEVRQEGDAALGPFAGLMDEDLLAKPENPTPTTEAAGEDSFDETLETAVASAMWLTPSENGEPAQQDIDSMIETLDDTEIGVLKELLVEYAMQGDTT